MAVKRDLRQVEVLRKLEEHGIKMTRQLFRQHCIAGNVEYDTEQTKHGYPIRYFNFEEVYRVIKERGYGDHSGVLKKATRQSDTTDISDRPFDPEKDKPTTLVEANTVKSVYQGKLQELKYKIEEGELVERHKVEDYAFRTARVIRDKLLSIPERLSNELYTMESSHAIRERLYEEIIATLENLSEDGTDLYDV
jgi:phenylalanyl-tRNA synthetase alpha subunit